MRDHVRMRDVRLYIRDLLIAYAAMQRFKPRVQPGASAASMLPLPLQLARFRPELCDVRPAVGGLNSRGPAWMGLPPIPVELHCIRSMQGGAHSLAVALPACQPARLRLCQVQAVQYTGAKLLQECQHPHKADAFHIAARVRHNSVMLGAKWSLPHV